MNPKVSVIIPTHNRAALLPRAVQSVLAQTFTDFELIIVDDASTDRTPSVVAAIADPRLRPFRHQRNLGVSAARNTGIANARGHYVAFLDDDDEWLPRKLQWQTDALDAAPETAAAYGWVDELDDSTGQRRPDHRPAASGRVFDAALSGQSLGYLSTWTVRTEVARAIPPFDERLTLGEDVVWLLMLARSHPVLAIPCVLALRHLGPRGTQLSRDAGPRYWKRQAQYERVLQETLAPDLAHRPRIRAHHHRRRAVCAAKLGQRRRALRHIAASLRAAPLDTLRALTAHLVRTTHP